MIKKLLVFVLTLSLAACGSEKEQTSSTASGTQIVSEVEDVLRKMKKF